ncbi:MAG: HAMP domain-containing histidine kinase [Defluviitaleaceae bacterium]|nr:HAMP domain-containing histidine kinase [Defluviitaleaceae bacterium]
MKFLRRVKRNLRSSILLAFSVLIFFSFALVGIAFNVATRQYIHNTAINALLDALSAHSVGLSFDTASDDLFNHVVARGNTVNIFHHSIGHFHVNNEYHLTGTTHVAYTTVRDITSALEAESADMHDMRPQRIRVGNTVYYVASMREMVILQHPANYTIYYINATDLQRFTANINLRILGFVAMIWFATMLMSTYLAGSLAKPLRNLSTFARQIGQGDFTPNPETFISEEFEELNQSLNHAAKQLAKYDNDQKAFFQNVSHELRTPLMSIKSYAEGIKYGVMDEKKASETILECTDRLTEMVGDILYVSRIDNITPPMMEEVNFVALVEERVAGQKSLAEGKGLSIELVPGTEGITISCVASYIERAVDNLISNAIRYAESKIILEISSTEARVSLTIVDDGPGFEPEKLPHVFERFYKGKNGLTGIGLSIVKSVVEQHKGTAAAQNGEKGAMLTISLPRM